MKVCLWPANWLLRFWWNAKQGLRPQIHAAECVVLQSNAAECIPICDAIVTGIAQ